MTARHILILGGTWEARTIAEAAHDLGHRVVTSLAGRTRNPALPSGQVISGGFGGPEGLAAFLTKEGVDLVIDATHPFAQQASTNAKAAAAAASCPLWVVARPLWRRRRGDRWTVVRDARTAAGLVAAGHFGRRVLLTLGAQEIGPFTAIREARIYARMVERPIRTGRLTILLDRGPYALADELVLLTDLGIQGLVAKQSGGEATYGKIEAARLLGRPVLMLRRPARPQAGKPLRQLIRDLALL